MDHFTEAMEWAVLEAERKRTVYTGRLRVALACLALAGFVVWMLYLSISEADPVPVLLLGLFLLVGAVSVALPISRRRQALRRLPAAITAQPATGQGEWDWAGEADQYGPNGAQVVEFLRRLPALTPEHWDVVVGRYEWEGMWLWSRERLSRKVIRAWERLAALDARDREAVALVEALEKAVDHKVIPFAPPYREFEATRQVALGLVDRDLFAEEEFAAVYHPFEPVIPADSL